MKVARLAMAPLAILLCTIHGCSDPPSPPPQGALTVKVSPTMGKGCPPAGYYVSVPTSESTGVFDHLQCDLSMGCKPDQFIVVDRDRGATVSCEVRPNNGNYSVSLTLNVDGSATGMTSINFQFDGTLTATGGMGAVTENNSAYGGGGSDSGCTVTIPPNKGVLKKGSVWAQFSCPSFRAQNDIADTQCLAEGIFLFENCTG